MAAEPAQQADDARVEQAQNGHLNGNGSASEDAVSAEGKKSKVDKRKEKKKKQKQNRQLRRQEEEELRKAREQAPASSTQGDEDIIIEYVSAPADLDFLSQGNGHEEAEQLESEFGGLGLGSTAGLGASTQDAHDAAASANAYEEFKAVLERFAPAEELTGTAAGEAAEPANDEQKAEEGAAMAEAPKATTSDTDSDDEEDGEGGSKLSRKQRKLLTRLKIAELKQVCERPDVVEVWDATASDAQLLVFLKAYRNTVSVPRHWSQKRKYLQGKRGIEKPPFKLPDFIEATGIGEMRQAYQEKEDAKKLKQKQRDRMAPKTGRMDIDYSILHDAFFKYQTKPKLTSLGELYYEGKEYEARIGNLQPGVLSSELRAALGMADDSPPPWLINMQRYGPPPSYPNLKIPGLSAPIPPGASFGYQPGGWGKPPVDEDGNPLYGDVFGVDDGDADSDLEVDRQARWGELESEVEESEEEEEEESEAEGHEEDFAAGIATDASGLATGLSSSLPSGIETPDTGMINLRKGGDSIAGTESAQHPQLYTVLEQKAAHVGQGALMGSDHVYVIPGAGEAGKAPAGAAPRVGDKRRAAALGGGADVEVTLDPEELEGLDDAAIKALYEERVAAAREAGRREDFSDMVAAQAAAQKRKIARAAESKAAKKQKDSFKF